MRPAGIRSQKLGSASLLCVAANRKGLNMCILNSHAHQGIHFVLICKPGKPNSFGLPWRYKQQVLYWRC